MEKPQIRDPLKVRDSNPPAKSAPLKDLVKKHDILVDVVRKIWFYKTTY